MGINAIQQTLTKLPTKCFAGHDHRQDPVPASSSSESSREEGARTQPAIHWADNVLNARRGKSATSGIRGGTDYAM